MTTGATGGCLSVWVDFDADGDLLDPQEQVVVQQVVPANTVYTANFTTPVGSPQGDTGLRARIASDCAEVAAPTGMALDGEVEDHLAEIGVEIPVIGAAKEVVEVVPVTPDHREWHVTYRLRIENFGNVPLSDVNATIDLSTVYAGAADFAVVSLTSPDFTVEPAYDGKTVLDLLAPGNALAIGESGTVDLVVWVRPGTKEGPYICVTEVVGTSPADVDVTDLSTDGTDPDPSADGDPGNDTTPTVVRFRLPVVDIPAAGDLGLLLLALLLAGAGLLRLRR